MKNSYNKTSEEVLESVNSKKEGLTSIEANNRLKEYGKNILPKKERDSILKIFFKEFLSPIELILVFTVIISLFIGEIVDALVILFIILVDVSMGTYQENKALKSAEALSNMLKTKCKVLRDNKEEFIDSDDLVIGDI